MHPIPIIDADIHPTPDPARRPPGRACLTGKNRLRRYEVTIKGDQIIVML